MAIEVAYDGAVATIRIARPEKLNALTLAMYADLGRAFAECGRDDRVHAVVLAGTGDRAFCVGADLNESIPALAADRFDISAWDPAHLKTSSFTMLLARVFSLRRRRIFRPAGRRLPRCGSTWLMATTRLFFRG